MHTISRSYAIWNLHQPHALIFSLSIPYDILITHLLPSSLLICHWQHYPDTSRHTYTLIKQETISEHKFSPTWLNVITQQYYIPYYPSIRHKHDLTRISKEATRNTAGQSDHATHTGLSGPPSSKLLFTIWKTHISKTTSPNISKYRNQLSRMPIVHHEIKIKHTLILQWVPRTYPLAPLGSSTVIYLHLQPQPMLALPPSVLGRWAQLSFC